MSKGQSLCIDDYQFFHGEDWLMAIAWPLCGAYDSGKFEAALAKAVMTNKNNPGAWQNAAPGSYGVYFLNYSNNQQQKNGTPEYQSTHE